jgi:tetratricopeptide (TPR) repeat protein
VIRAALFALLVVGAAVACGTRDDDGDGKGSVTRLAQPGPELSEELMLGLALAKNLHHKADVYLKEGRIEEAVASVQQILSVKFPPRSPEAEDVLLDARARLAKLMIIQGKLDQATAVVDAGIKGTTRQSFFLANLHSVRGEVLEATAQRMEESDPRARQTRHEAIGEFAHAIEIEQALLDQLHPEEAP